MNNPESITVSPETAKKLRAAGYNGDTVFVRQVSKDEYYVVPTAEEILRELPRTIKQCGLLINRNRDGKYEVAYMAGHKPKRADTLVEALAQMWLYLSENNLLPNHA